MILTTLFLLVLIEFLYNFYKKDSFYSLKETLPNILNQILIIFINNLIPVFSVIGGALFINNFFPHLDYFNIRNNFLSFIFGLLILDLMYYIFHRASHKFKILWSIHFAHHSDTKLNLSTGFRGSIFETPLRYIFYFPLLILGFPIKMFLIIISVNSMYGFLKHSRYIPSYKMMDYIFATPKNHLIHHDQNLKNQNSNFGLVFSFWDRLFKTYTENIDIQNFKAGIKSYYQNNFLKIQIDPILDYFKK